jgi:hypothetical protein
LSVLTRVLLHMDDSFDPDTVIAPVSTDTWAQISSHLA